jgi:hypothetical protein
MMKNGLAYNLCTIDMTYFELYNFLLIYDIMILDVGELGRLSITAVSVFHSSESVSIGES